MTMKRTSFSACFSNLAKCKQQLEAICCIILSYFKTSIFGSKDQRAYIAAMLADENLPQKGLYYPKNKDSCKIHSASHLLGESVKNSVLFLQTISIGFYNSSFYGITGHLSFKHSSNFVVWTHSVKIPYMGHRMATQ